MTGAAQLRVAADVALAFARTTQLNAGTLAATRTEGGSIVTPWWNSLEAGTLCRVVLLQCDIGGHSRWVETQLLESRSETYAARADLAAALALDLESLEYPRLFWAGDGGVFAARLSEMGHAETLVPAADAAFRCFRKWKSRHRATAAELTFRLTGTTIEVNVDRMPGNWCSTEFNTFLKFERHLAIADGFVITQELRGCLGKRLRKRFPKERPVVLPNGDVITTYIDTKHTPTAQHSDFSFRAWLDRRTSDPKLVAFKALPAGLVSVGGCTVLDASRKVNGYGEIVLEPLAPSDPSSGIENVHRAKWRRSVDKLATRKVRGTSLSAVQFIPELSDDPHPRLRYRAVDYKDASRLLKSAPGGPTLA